MTYVTPSEVRAMAQSMTTSAVPPATDDLVRDLIARASRYFDLQCGVDPGYFDPALYPVWESNHAYVVGDIVTPTTRNSHKYRVTTAGTSAATEPTFPTSASGTVTSGGVVFTENGADVVATSRTLYGNGLNYLKLPPYVPGTLNASITYVNDLTAPTFIESEGFLVLTGTTGNVPPFRYPGSGWYAGEPLTVTALWGYEATPEDVKMAVIELAINLWRETDPASLKMVSLEGVPLREKCPPRVLEAARRYGVKTATVAFV